MIQIDNIKAYDVQEAAQLLNVSAQTIRKYIKTGKLKAQKTGVKYVVTERELKDYLRRGYTREENG
jgi:excisionase family DNA binding protein